MTTPPTPTGPEDVTRSKATPDITEGESKAPPEGQSFQAYMKAGPTSAEATQTPQTSPFDLAQGKVAPPGPTFDTIQAQAKTAHAALGDVSTQLKTPKLKLKQSKKYILKNKLNAAKARIRSASQKMGAKEVPDTEVPSGAGPIQRFLATVTDGQNQLQEAQQMLSNLKDKGQNLSPADMLSIQVKLNKAQQEIEYSSILLSKAVDDIKMLMNIQL